MMNAVEVGSHAVYPRASKVLRIPPLGKLEASGSCCISSPAPKCSIAFPSAVGERNESCFSAVAPVSG